MSSSRKPLIRSNSHSDRPTTMRNWPLFVFLIGLVLFFYIFYVYQAQSASLTSANDEIRLLNSQLQSTKNKLVDTLATLEGANTVQKTLTSDLEDSKKKQDECITALRSSKLRLDGLEKEKQENSVNYTKIQEELSSLKERSEEVNRNNTSLLKMISAQESLIQQLNQTVSLLKFETSQLRASKTQPQQSEKITEKSEELHEQEKTVLAKEREISDTKPSTISTRELAPSPADTPSTQASNVNEEDKPEENQAAVPDVI